MHALITGGAGFIGSTLADRLLAEGHTVDIVDDLSSGSLANLAGARTSSARRVSFHQLDVRSDALAELMARRRPELVFHLAGRRDAAVVERDLNLGYISVNTAEAVYGVSVETLTPVAGRPRYRVPRRQP